MTRYECLRAMTTGLRANGCRQRITSAGKNTPSSRIRCTPYEANHNFARHHQMPTREAGGHKVTFTMRLDTPRRLRTPCLTRESSCDSVSFVIWISTDGPVGFFFGSHGRLTHG
ncbi:hypothetical protein MLPF_2650 [Mycobacterium lepromatosis]|nr:hypothetical protein MLPF_2650 [Mycobacterium lepromatosis]